jgi:hypothetical protein
MFGPSDSADVFFFQCGQYNPRGFMPSYRIKSSPRVKSGQQYRSQRSLPEMEFGSGSGRSLRILRKHPGKGFRHVLLIRDIRLFLSILPDWPTLSEGLNTILLAPARPNSDGFHRPGLVAICAQDRNPSSLIKNAQYIHDHRDILARIGVPIEQTSEGHFLHFTPNTLRTFQLLHVFLHELGHHHDRMCTHSKRQASRGEKFAEMYARTHADYIWSRYLELFAP